MMAPTPTSEHAKQAEPGLTPAYGEGWHRFGCRGLLTGLAASMLASLALAQTPVHDSTSAVTRTGPSEITTAAGPFQRTLDLRVVPKAHSGPPMAQPIDKEPGQEHDEEARRFTGWTHGATLDAVATASTNLPRQAWRAPEAFGQPSPVFNGINYTNVVPADPTGDAGLNHYVQAVNGSPSALFSVFNKTTGALLAGPISFGNISTGNCVGADSDPQVVYDNFAGRWVLARLMTASGRICVHLSAGEDPINTTWTQYEFTFSFFPDYPKLAVWDNAYALVTNNEFADPGTTNYRTRFVVLDRTAMLAGQAATAQTFQSSRFSDRFRPFTPSTPIGLKGHNPAKPGTPIMFMILIDDEFQFFEEPLLINGAADRLDLYSVTPNFADPNSSVMTGPTPIPTLDFQSVANRFPAQPGTSIDLPAFNGTAMHRSTYRNLGDREVITLSTNQATGPFSNYNDQTLGARFGAVWFELQRIGGAASPWQVASQGVFDLNDGTSRFMSAINVDNAGNLAMAYSVLSDTNNVFAGLRYTGRSPGDPDQTMTLAETTIANGVAAQLFTGASQRWGDYFDMSIDPDGCRYWFTGTYMDDSTWGTRVASFKHDSCGAPNFAFSGPSSVFKVCNTATASLPTQTVQVNSRNGYWRDVTLDFPTLPAGFNASVNPTSVRPSTLVTTNISVAAGTSPGLYSATLQGTEGALNNQFNFQVDVDQPAAAANQTAPANAATSQPSIVRLQWDPIPGADDYVVEVDTDNTFTPPLTMSRLSSNTFLDTDLLAGNTTYFWRVRGRNTCGEGANGTVRSFTTIANFCKTVNTALAAGATVQDTITIPAAASGVVQNLDVRFVENNAPATGIRVDVTRLSDNRTVRLFDTGCNASNAMNTTFDDAASAALCNGSPVASRIAPTQALSAFDNGSLAGDWRISVSNTGSTGGQFILWCLQPQNLVPPGLFTDGFE